MIGEKKLIPSRINKDEYGILLAHIVSLRSTCRRRRAGCVVIDRNKHIKGTGYNGVSKNRVHCLDVPCSGAEASSGNNLDECMAVHAEENALLQMESKSSGPFTIYCTCSPCLHCAKLITNFPDIKRMVVSEIYPDPAAIEMIKESGIIFEVISFDPKEILKWF